MNSTQQTLPPRSTASLPDTLSQEGCKQVIENGWPFFWAGIALVNCRDEIMLVKEAKERRIQDGREVWVPTTDGKWRLPYGPMRPWDNLQMAADHHGTDQTAHDFDLGGICHIGFRLDIDDPHVIVIYHADCPYVLAADRPNPEKVATVDWFDYEKVEQLATAGLLSDPELTPAVVQAERNHIVIPNEAVIQYQSRYAHD